METGFLVHSYDMKMSDGLSALVKGIQLNTESIIAVLLQNMHHRTT